LGYFLSMTYPFHKSLNVTACAALLFAVPWAASAQLVINELRYNVTPQGGNQYVELFNGGSTNAYLDGMILTDEAGSGTEGVFQFPGLPGETNHPVLPGAFVLIAVDASGATASADWECMVGGTDSDNLSVPNLTLVAGTADLGLSATGDNVLLTDGTDTTIPIDPATVVDGVNFNTGGGELAPLSALASDADASLVSSTNTSLCRCPDGQDGNASSTTDFVSAAPTPGTANNCDLPILSLIPISLFEGNSGSTTAQFNVVMSTTNALTVTVYFSTSNGTADAGIDYVATNGMLSFAPGNTSQTILVTINGDTTTESDETLYLWLTHPTNATLATNNALGSILNDDLAVVTSSFVRIDGTGGALTSTWSATSGTVYQLQSSGNLLTPAWSNVSGAVTALSSSAFVVDTEAVLTQRFYRVIQYY
jgi:hypothetical protein